MSRKYIGYAGQMAIVFVSLYLLFTVGMDFYLYDVEYSDGSDDARWTIPNESWDYENTIGLLLWGFYLLVTGIQAQVRKSVDSPPDMLTKRSSSHGTCFPIKSSTFSL